jgi:hypothetical protein
MNIFYLHRDPVKAAVVQYNKHVVKMILESAQMLCTAHHCYGSDEQKANTPYRQAHLNHPSTVWARSSVQRYMWLYNHMLALGEEYTRRYGKTHLAIHKCKDFLSRPPKNIKQQGWSEPPQCMPDEYKVEGDSVSAYWNYYINAKSNIVNSNEKPYKEKPNL